MSSCGRSSFDIMLPSSHLLMESYIDDLLRGLSLDAWGEQEANYMSWGIHEGSCESHVGGCTLVQKMLLVSYFWPTLEKDAKRLVKYFESCQRHQPRQSRLAEWMKSSVAMCRLISGE